MNDFYCEQVLNGKVEVRVISDNNSVLAFYHTKPSYEIHVVIVPKVHYTDLLLVPDSAMITNIFDVIKSVIKELKLSDYRVITNGGKYQDSKHLHFHLVSGNRL